MHYCMAECATCVRPGQEPGIFCSADAVYILAISVIMLNTDKHNPAVRATPSLL